MCVNQDTLRHFDRRAGHFRKRDDSFCQAIAVSLIQMINDNRVSSRLSKIEQSQCAIGRCVAQYRGRGVWPGRLCHGIEKQIDARFVVMQLGAIFDFNEIAFRRSSKEDVLVPWSKQSAAAGNAIPALGFLHLNFA